MNIFYLSHDVDECAQYHVDKHVVKMILEYAQLLSTTHRVLDGKLIDKKYIMEDSKVNEGIYKATHINHPSTIWVRQSKENYVWLYRLWMSLMQEYTYRYDKRHACERLKNFLKVVPKNIKDEEFTEPTPAMPDLYKIDGDSIASYRNYYSDAKRNLHSWKNRYTPEWIV